MAKRRLPSEFELIARYFAPLARAFPGAYGLLNDAATIGPASGHELVVKTDTVVGGIDFPPDEPANLVARKALRVNLSDLAAKGASPRAYLVDLILPDTGLATDYDDRNLAEKFYRRVRRNSGRERPKEFWRRVG